MSNALTSINYVVLEALYFIILTTVNLDFTLTTQVLADGNVLIVCVDDRGNAMHKFYMNQEDDQQRRSSRQDVIKVGEWQTVKDEDE